MRFSFQIDDDNIYLAARLKSEKLMYTAQPYILFKTFDGEVIKLRGTYVGTQTESVGIPVGNIIVNETEQKHTAHFPITLEQLKKFRDKGIAKIRVGTTPKVRDKMFDQNDGLGEDLYKAYSETQNDLEEF